MPHIRVRGMYENDVRKVAPKFVDEVVKIVECPRDHVSIEVVPTIWIEASGASTAYPFVEMHWFDRGQEIQNKIASVLTDVVIEEGFEEVAVLFYPLEEKKYYDNGEHY